MRYDTVHIRQKRKEHQPWEKEKETSSSVLNKQELPKNLKTKSNSLCPFGQSAHSASFCS